jgi:hypothetical protein
VRTQRALVKYLFSLDFIGDAGGEGGIFRPRHKIQ